MSETSSVKAKLWWSFHLLLVLLAWAGPFLADWYIVSFAYGLVLLQFLVFNRCLINAQHDLKESDDHNTFYAELLESVGIRFKRKPLKVFVRGWLYGLLGLFAFLIQFFGGYNPPLHLQF